MGEVVGLAGLRGSGRTEIMKAIAGIDPPLSGTIRLLGNPIRFSHPNQAFANGVAYLPEEREKEGIIDILSVEKNLNLIVLQKLKNKLGILSKRLERESAQELIEKFEIKCNGHEQEIRYLSGGNKQKAVFGKIYSTEPSVYLLDEPTKGIDISTKGVLLAMIRNELTKKAGVILSAPGLDDLIKVCDRIYVLFEGEILEIVDRINFDEKELYLGIQGIPKREAGNP
jgi:ABC-type sugar transport system ATPase subunit